MIEKISFEVDVCTGVDAANERKVTTTVVELDKSEAQQYLTSENLYEVAGLVEYAARKNVASLHIDYELHIAKANQNDSTYLDALDRLADGYRVTKMFPTGTFTRFEVDAQYGENGQPFSDFFFAIDATAAEFQARWALSEQEGGDPLDCSFEEWIEQMDNHTIHWCVQAKVSPQEALDLLTRVHTAYRDGDDLKSVMAEVELVLIGGLDVTPTPEAFAP